MSAGRLVLGVLVLLAVLALVLQQQLTARTSTLRERLQHVPDQVVDAVSKVATSAALVDAASQQQVAR